MNSPIIHIHNIILVPMVVVGLIGPEFNGVDVDNNPPIFEVPCLGQQGSP